MTTKTMIKLAPALAAGALAASAVPASAATVTASSGGLRATLHVGTSHPRVNHRWPVQVTATLNGHAVRAGAFYQFLFSGQDQSDQAVCQSGTPGCNNWNFKFTGRYNDVIIFPKEAQAKPLTVRVVVFIGRVTKVVRSGTVPYNGHRQANYHVTGVSSSHTVYLAFNVNPIR
jgi:hypothetical protein